MKKLIILAIAAIAATLLLSNCKKDNTVYDSYFYTSNDSNDTKLSLFIDNDYKGDLPFLQKKPTCDSTALKVKCLHISLPAGKHKLTAKDQHGNIKSETTFKLKTNLFGSEKMSSSGYVGGDETNHKGDCLIINLFF